MRLNEPLFIPCLKKVYQSKSNLGLQFGNQAIGMQRQNKKYEIKKTNKNIHFKQGFC